MRLARGRQRSTLLGLAGHALVSLVAGVRGIVMVGVSLVGVRAGPVVAVLGRTGILGAQGHRACRRGVRMACGALRADTMCVRQCEE
ncbi:xanthosine utilization system XapX-like protein [Streptomyces sp. V4I23]|nr:xanthosine utilization system XapX-like protein [Streptomyces sp. V4I23]